MNITKLNPPDKSLDTCPIKPMGWRLVIAPYEPEDTTAGGIVLAKEAVESERLLTFCGRVVAMGEACFSAVTRSGIDMNKFAARPKVGDWVIYGVYGGQRVVTKSGARYIITNDDAVLAIVEGPQAFKYYL